MGRNGLPTDDTLRIAYDRGGEPYALGRRVNPVRRLSPVASLSGARGGRESWAPEFLLDRVRGGEQSGWSTEEHGDSIGIARGAHTLRVGA